MITNVLKATEMDAPGELSPNQSSTQPKPVSNFSDPDLSGKQLDQDNKVGPQTTKANAD